MKQDADEGKEVMGGKMGRYLWKSGVERREGVGWL